MDSTKGWVPIYRKLLDSKYGNNLEMIGFWTYILLEANHESKYDRDGNVVHPGTFRTGRKKLSKLFNVSEYKIESMLKKLESEQQIIQETTNKFRVIRVVNWGRYRDVMRGERQQKDNKKTQRRKTLLSLAFLLTRKRKRKRIENGKL